MASNAPPTRLTRIIVDFAPSKTPELPQAQSSLRFFDRGFPIIIRHNNASFRWRDAKARWREERAKKICYPDDGAEAKSARPMTESDCAQMSYPGHSNNRAM
jgi:hypothetical protein